MRGNPQSRRNSGFPVGVPTAPQCLHRLSLPTEHFSTRRLQPRGALSNRKTRLPRPTETRDTHDAPSSPGRCRKSWPRTAAESEEGAPARVSREHAGWEGGRWASTSGRLPLTQFGHWDPRLHLLRMSTPLYTAVMTIETCRSSHLLFAGLAQWSQCRCKYSQPQLFVDCVLANLPTH